MAITPAPLETAQPPRVETSPDSSARRPHRRLAEAARPYRFAIRVYVATRALLFAVAAVNGAVRHHAFLTQLAWWDGQWYQWLANHGYPSQALHVRSTLGFFPLYPIVIRAVAYPVHAVYGHAMLHSIDIAGVAVSVVGGLVATVLVQRLATGWWDEPSGRRAAVLFCVFPGSVVFSMVYAEGILIPLAAGCLLALERRRWLLAGCLAGLATATEPEAVVLVLACAVSAGLELRRRGPGDRSARASLLAPALSLTGLCAFALYLWAHTGTPFATMIAQRYGWQEKTDPFALVHLARSLLNEVSFSHFNHPTINLNLVVGLGGAAFLLGLLVLMWRQRRAISPEAIVWTLGISFLAVTSENTPPNPRLLITAFPAIVVLAPYLKRRRYVLYVAANTLALAGLSALTFAGTTLRP